MIVTNYYLLHSIIVIIYPGAGVGIDGAFVHTG